MKNVAEFKRIAQPGVTFNLVNHRYPELSGNRTVVKAQSNRLCLTLPQTHPRFSEVEGSWLDIPKASECTFTDGAVTIHHDGIPFCTISDVA